MTKRLTICVSVLVAVLFCSNASASVFPNDAETAYYSFTSNVVNYPIITVPSANYTILYVSFSSSSGDAGGTISLGCGSIAILDVKNLNLNANFERFETRRCSSNVLLSTTSLGASVKTSVRLVYVKYDLTKVPTNMIVLASASFPTEPLLSSIASNSLDILPVYASMTAGDLGIMIGLFAIVIILMLQMLWRKNKFS